MRTLKKTLALVLVLSMMFSLCVTASAADFKDQDEITNAKAVATLVGLGVIEGMPDETFDPAGTLTRAQAAKIIAYIMGVGEYAADPAETGFTDVAADHWASGYIAYCAGEGILDGYGDGKFGPSDALTGYHWTKMLLCALGYDSAIEGYTGSAWQINVAKDAVTAGIWTGAAADKKDAISRDEACLYAYNVLNADTVYYVTIVSGTPAQQSGDDFDVVNLGIDVEEGTDNSVFGAPEAIVTGTPAKGEAVEYYSETAELVASYTTSVTRAQILKDLGGKQNTVAFTEQWIDGVEMGKFDWSATSAANLAAAWDKSGNGVLVEIYAADDASTKEVTEYVITVVNTYVDTLAKDDIIAADAAKEIKAGIMLTVDDELVKYDTEETFAKDDVVLYTVANGKVQSAVVAESVTGKITAVANGYIRIDGEKYEAAAIYNLPVATNSTAKVYYLDEYGYIIKDADVKDVEKEDAPTELLMILKLQAKAANAGASDLFGEVTAASDAAAKAVILDLATGEVKTVDVAVAYDEDTEKWYYVDTNGDLTATEVVKFSNAGRWVREYAVLEDGTYAINLSNATTTEVTLEKGKAAVATGLTATSKTVLSVVEIKTDAKTGEVTGAAVTNTTGIANFPVSAATADAYVTSDKGVVSEIVVVQNAAPVAVPVTYAVYAAQGETDAEGNVEHSFYVGGELVTYVAGKTFDTELAPGTVYNIELTSGKLTKAEAAGVDKTGTVALIDETFINLTVGEGEEATTETLYLGTYTVVDGEVATGATAATYAVAELEVGDAVEIYTGTENDETVVQFVVITKNYVEE